MAFARPEPTEAAEYYFRYIDQVPDGDIRELLVKQRDEALAFFASIPDERTRTPYAPGKWTLRQVLALLNDTERLFAFRAMWFARGMEAPLPSFEQDIAVANNPADHRSWQSHLDEFRTIRDSTIDLFRHLPDEAWSRQGTASDYPFSVRALAYIIVGHVAHHIAGAKANYL